MSTVRVYIKPFDDDGVYKDWVDVTDDVVEGSIGKFSQQLDNTEYDIGIFRTANITFKLRNTDGTYSDVTNANSMFRYKRRDSLVKFTWSAGQESLVCGFFTCPAVLSYEEDAFKGLLNDDSVVEDIEAQTVQFGVLGLEYLMQKTKVPYGSLSIGQTAANLIYTCLNQAPITALITVTLGNITLDLNQTVDAVTWFENKTVLEAVSHMLLLSNSVMTIDNDIIYAKPRDESASLMFTFYGQASDDGIENILDIMNFRTGMNRVFNFVRWKDTSLVSEDTTSTAKFGLIVKELESTVYNDNTKRTNILAQIKNEFSTARMELQITTYITSETLALKLLDKVNINYPAIAIVADDVDLPIYGIAQYGIDKYPDTLSNFELNETQYFKIMARSVDIRNDMITFNLREVG
jgi:hypothetical protein